MSISTDLFERSTLIERLSGGHDGITSYELAISSLDDAARIAGLVDELEISDYDRERLQGILCCIRARCVTLSRR